MGRKRAENGDGSEAVGKTGGGVKRVKLVPSREGKAGLGTNGSDLQQTKVKRRVGRPRSAKPTKSLTVSLSLSGDEIGDNPEENENEDNKSSSASPVNINGKRTTPRTSKSPKVEDEEPKSCIQGETSLSFVEPPLCDGAIVTGQPLGEPPNINAKRELSFHAKKRGPKPKGFYDSNVCDEDVEKVSQLEKKLVDLSSIETKTKLSTERRSLKQGKLTGIFKTNGSKEETPKQYLKIPKLSSGRAKSLSETSPVKTSKPLKKSTDLSQKHNETEPELSDNQEEETTNVNQDFCSCCGLPGMFLCCETCPRSFHFHCLNPPVDSKNLPERWFCKECNGKKIISETGAAPDINVGILSKLLSHIDYENPTVFRLPREIIDAFQGISIDKIGDFEDDSFKEQKSYKELIKELDDPLYGVYDSNDNPYLCYSCGKSKKPRSSDMMKCDYCPLSWHLDCLEPPLTSVKMLGSKWKCPNHADTIVKLRRKMRDQPSVEVDSTKATDIPIDAHVDIINVDDRLFQYKDGNNDLIYQLSDEFQGLERKVQLGNVTYVVKEEDIVLDFLKGAKIRKIQEERENVSLFKSLESTTKGYVESLSKLSARPIISHELKERCLNDLLTVTGDEIKAQDGAAELSNDDISELLAIKRLMERKGKKELLEFLKSK